MADKELMPNSPYFLVHLQDCVIAAAVMAFIYLIAGTTGLVLLVFGYSISVVVFLLLREAYLRFDLDDDNEQW